VVSTTNHHRNRCKAVEQLENEYAGVQGEMAYKYPIHRNKFHNVMYLKKTDTKRNEIGS
jgi:aspartate-semialdehyde dehydrogenase